MLLWCTREEASFKQTQRSKRTAGVVVEKRAKGCPQEMLCPLPCDKEIWPS